MRKRSVESRVRDRDAGLGRVARVPCAVRGARRSSQAMSHIRAALSDSKWCIVRARAGFDWVASGQASMDCAGLPSSIEPLGISRTTSNESI